MRKFFNPLPDGGAPIYNTEINGVLQTEFWDVIQQTMTSILNGSSPNVIVSGGILTDNGDGTLDITSGLAYMDDGSGSNQFMRFPSYTNVVFPAYLASSVEVVEQIEFADTVDRNYISEYTGEVVPAAPIYGFITLDFPVDDQIYFKNILAKQSLFSLLIDDLNAQRRGRPILVANVDAAGVMSVSYALEGTWAATPQATGNYSITQDGGTPLETAVVITPTEITGGIGVSGKYQPSNGFVKLYNNTTGAEIDSGFTIVIYPL